MTATAHPFLLQVLRRPDDVGSADLPEDGAWERIVADALLQGLGPLLHRWLRRHDLGGRLPAEAAARLRAYVAGVAARNLVLADELTGILRAFAGAGLACAPLRGLALAESLYGDAGARPMGDLDLLVRREDLDPAAAVLRGLGYRELDRSPGFARRFSHTLEFFRDRHGWIMVEPHWTIAYPPFLDRIDMAEVWRQCGRGQVAGVETWALAPEDLLLHLCLHVTHRDPAAPLLWLCDIDRLVRREAARLDWSALVARARETGLAYPLGRVLGEVRALFGTPVPDAVLGGLDAPPARALEGRLVRLLAGGARVDGKESFALLLTLPGWRARFAFARGLLFPSPEFMRTHYALTRRGQLGLAYLRRLASLSAEGVKGIVSLLTTRP